MESLIKNQVPIFHNLIILLSLKNHCAGQKFVKADLFD